MSTSRSSTNSLPPATTSEQGHSSQVRRSSRRVARTLLASLAGAPLLGAALAVSAAGAQTGTLQPQLLQVSDLGSGWAVITTTGGGIGCLMNVLEPAGVHQTATVTADFRHSNGTPQLFEQIAEYSSEPTAYAKAITGLSHCHKVSGDPGGDPTTGTVRRIHFATFGKKDKSVAYDARLDVAGLSVDEVFVIVSTGTELLALTEANIGTTANIPQFMSIAKTAAAKL